jgi:hypothetical protein
MGINDGGDEMNEKKITVYINGRKASKADRARLEKDLKSGRQRATAHTTKAGAIAIKTEY